MTTVVGLDPSLTSTGLVALVSGDAALCDRVRPLAGLTGPPRLAAIRDRVLGFCRDTEPDLVALEGYSFGSRTSHAHALGELGGVLRLALWEAGFHVLDVPPSTLKKFAAGRGNAPKDVVRLEVSKRWGFEHDAHDVVDAYALARLGEATLDPALATTAPQRAAVAALRREEGQGGAGAPARRLRAIRGGRGGSAGVPGEGA